MMLTPKKTWLSIDVQRAKPEEMFKLCAIKLRFIKELR
jgi:hypothetical protein